MATFFYLFSRIFKGKTENDSSGTSRYEHLLGECVSSERFSCLQLLEQMRFTGE
jgi:hypothetical protein